MVDVRISDTLYEQASQAAKARQVSVDEFVEQVVQKSLGESEAITLTPDQMEKVRHAQAQVKAGQILSMDQVDQRSALNRAKWEEANRV